MNSFCPRHWSLKQRLEHRSIRDPKTGCILWTGVARALARPIKKVATAVSMIANPG